MDADARRLLVVAMTDLGWSQADADEWDELFGLVVADAVAQTVQGVSGWAGEKQVLLAEIARLKGELRKAGAEATLEN